MTQPETPTEEYATVDMSAVELLEAIRRDWPKEYEISALRMVGRVQAQHVAELEARLAALEGGQ